MPIPAATFCCRAAAKAGHCEKGGPRCHTDLFHSRARAPPRQHTGKPQARSTPTVIHLRDGEVVLYRRAGSPYWQVRYKLRTGAWARESTAQAAIENAIPTACELYDEARFRQKLGVAHKGTTFTAVAYETLSHLRLEMDAGRGRVIYSSYISVIERYFLPYFGERHLETLTAREIALQSANQFGIETRICDPCVEFLLD